MKNVLLAGALSLAAATAMAAPVKYDLDPSHSQIVFSYEHLGFSTTYGMFSGFGGEIMFDVESPANSSVAVSMPVKSMITGWEARFGHFMAADFFDATDEETVSFVSTGIELTGETTAKITGDLTLNGVTKSVVLDANLTRTGDHPQAGKPWAGFNATTTLLRSDYNVGAYAPYVSDEVKVMISIEAGKSDDNPS